MSSCRECDCVVARRPIGFSSPSIWKTQTASIIRHWKIVMTIFVPTPTSRRSFLACMTGLVAAARLPRAAAEDSNPVKEFKLTAATGRVSLVGKPHPGTDVWCYGDSVPGPEIRLRQGELV